MHFKINIYILRAGEIYAKKRSGWRRRRGKSRIQSHFLFFSRVFIIVSDVRCSTPPPPATMPPSTVTCGMNQVANATTNSSYRIHTRRERKATAYSDEKKSPPPFARRYLHFVDPWKMFFRKKSSPPRRCPAPRTYTYFRKLAILSEELSSFGGAKSFSGNNESFFLSRTRAQQIKWIARSNK